MLNRLARASRVAPTLCRQASRTTSAALPASASLSAALRPVQATAAMSFSTDSSASSAGGASIHDRAYEEIAQGRAQAMGKVPNPNAPVYATGNNWAGQIYSADMKPVITLPRGYNPETQEPVRYQPSTLMPQWSVRHLRTPDTENEPSYKSVVADIPAINRTPRVTTSAFAAPGTHAATSRFNFKHTFTLVELTHNEFLKKLVLLENKLIDKFGSTAVLRVVKRGAPIKKRWALLRSPFVHKRAQDHLEYRAHEYNLQVSYTFQLDDAVLNQYVFSTLKQVLKNIGSVTRHGYHIDRRSSVEDKYVAHGKAARAALAAAEAPLLATTAAESVNAAMQHMSQSKNVFYEYVAEAEREQAAELEATREQREAEARAMLERESAPQQESGVFQAVTATSANRAPTAEDEDGLIMNTDGAGAGKKGGKGGKRN